MVKWFIDCNNTIYPVFGAPHDPDWFVASDDHQIVYVIDSEQSVIGEYILWNSLTELAATIEGK